MTWQIFDVSSGRKKLGEFETEKEAVDFMATQSSGIFEIKSTPST